MRNRAVFAIAMLWLLVPQGSSAQSMEFDAPVMLTFRDLSMDGCLYNTASGQGVASVSMAPGAVGLAIHFPTLNLQRTYGDPACPATTTLSPPDAHFSLPRRTNNVNIQYSLEIDRDGVTDILGVGGVGQGHLLLQVYFCDEADQSGCTWSRTVTNRILVSLYYRFSNYPGTILQFFGQYLGPNPGRQAVPSITTPPVLPQGFLGEPYRSFRFEAIGGTPPFTWQAATPPPPLLSVMPDGSLTGTPQAIGDHRFTVTARDAVGLTAAKELTLPVADTRPIQIATSPLLPEAFVGRPYNAQVCATGGTPPYDWSGVVAFPPGLSIVNAGHPTCGRLTGQALLPLPIGFGPWPTELTPVPVVITARDSAGRRATQVAALQILQMPNVDIKTPSIKGQLYGKALLQLTTGVLASIIATSVCTPAFPPCWKFSAVVISGFVTPGIYDLLAAMDPPDPEFTTVVEPQVRQPLPRLPANSGIPAAWAATANELVRNAEQRIALADAYRATIDKVQGALQADDQCWAGGQLHTAERFAGQLAELTAEERRLRTSLHGMLAGLPKTTISAAQLGAFQQEVRSTGFPALTRQVFQEAGVDPLSMERLHYLLDKGQLDLASAAGEYGFDGIGGTRTPATVEDEQAWRSIAAARGFSRYPCADAGLSVAFNATSFSAPAQLVVTARLLPIPAVTQPVDTYIVVQFPTGALLSLREDGRVTAGISPYSRGRAPYTFNKTVLTYALDGSEPRGTYTWYTAMTQPGTLNFVTPIRSTQFTVH